MTPPLQILGFGAISIDELIYVDQPLSAGKGKVKRRVTSHGGNVATALAAAAGLSARTGFIGWLSTQPEHKSSQIELEKQGVDTSHAPRSAKAAPVFSTITVGSDGDRVIAYDDDVLHGTDPHFPDEVLAQAQVLIVDGYATNSIDVISRAHALGLQILADIEWTIGAETTALMALTDHLVLPWEFAAKVTGENSAPAILNALWSPTRAGVVVTRGAQGAYALEKGDATVWHIPAYETEAVDTTGAGDCFHGAYAVALVHGKTPVQSAAYAAAAAAISTTGLGGRGALPTHEACIELMATNSATRPAPVSS